MNKATILLAEDEPIMGKLIKEALELRNFRVFWASDGLKAMSSFMTEKPDICILDVMMPYKDGFSVAQDIRAINKHIPIIFLTAKSTIQDLAEGFQTGANDYIKKPFSLEELIIRMEALMGRTKKETIINTNDYKIGAYHFDFNNLTLSVGIDTQVLSYKEAQLLKLLIDHKESILDRKVALDHVWGDDSYFNSRSMDVFISKIRKMLERDPRLKIVNIRGKGFKLIESYTNH